MARIKYRYNCDEYTARAILGSRIQRAHSMISVMNARPGISPAMQGKLEEVERFFAESPDEILCYPYAPASDKSVDELRKVMASIGWKVPYYENCSHIRSGISKLAWRFTMRLGTLSMKGIGKPVIDTGDYVQIFPGTAKGKKVWKQRKELTMPMKDGDELWPSARRLKEIITDQQHWFEDYKVFYRGTDFSGMRAIPIVQLIILRYIIDSKSDTLQFVPSESFPYFCSPDEIVGCYSSLANRLNPSVTSPNPHSSFDGIAPRKTPVSPSD